MNAPLYPHVYTHTHTHTNIVCVCVCVCVCIHVYMYVCMHAYTNVAHELKVIALAHNVVVLPEREPKRFAFEEHR
jgi:hypothetical protein